MPTDAFPAEAGPTKCTRCVSGTGFSREEASGSALNFAACPPTPSRLKPVPLIARGPTKCKRCVSGTGFSREKASGSTLNFAACPPTPSRVKPVLRNARGVSVGLALAGRGQWQHPQFRSGPTDAFPAEAGPTGCTRCLCGTGFSREEASGSTLNFAVCLPTPSRLKPVLRNALDVSVGLALAGKRSASAPSILQCAYRRVPG